MHELSPGLVLTDLLLKDAGIRERMLFNAVAETPETVAATLVPRIRTVTGSGGLLRYQPVILMVARISPRSLVTAKGVFSMMKVVGAHLDRRQAVAGDQNSARKRTEISMPAAFYQVFH